MNNSEGLAYAINNLAEDYFDLKNYTLALKYYQESLKIYKIIDSKEGISVCYNQLSSVYLELNRPMFAKEYAKKGLNQAIEIQQLEYMTQGVSFLYQADSALGDWKSAFEHHKLYKQYSDSLHNEDKAKEFGRIESRYQFEKEAEEQKRKETEAKRLAEIEIERRNNLQYLSIFGGLMVLFGVLAFIGRFRIPARVLDIALFATLLILFEFLLILFDPILDRYTGGIPIQKLVFNSVIALGFAPLHGFLEKKLRGRFVKASPN